jgi:Recombination endonuclease VII
MKLCSLDGCDRPIRARNLCGSHYQKSITKPKPKSTRHSLSNVAVDGLTATCSVCGPDTSIYTRPDGFRRCRTVERAREMKRDRSDRPQGYSTRYVFADGQSIPAKDAADAIARLRAEQQQLCAICKKHESETGTLCLDHCHDTGEIRGLLCRKCNAGIGLLGDNLETVRAATAYLSR